jgi:hypothetical protein
LKHNVGLQITDDLIVSKHRVLWKIHEILDLVFVVKFNSSLSDEVDLSKLLSILNHSSLWLVYPAIHVDNQFICKASFTVVKEVFEVLLKVLEYEIHDFCLHLWRYLVVEWKLLYYEVIVMQKCILNVLLDYTIEVWWNIVRFIRLFDLLDPYI